MPHSPDSSIGTNGPTASRGHFAQSYRSGHVFNFVLGALAVLLALATLVLPDAKKVLAVAEFVAVLAILVNTWVGTRSNGTGGGWIIANWPSGFGRCAA